MKSGPKHMQCTEDEDFMAAFDKMLEDNTKVIAYLTCLLKLKKNNLWDKKTSYVFFHYNVDILFEKNGMKQIFDGELQSGTCVTRSPAR